MKTRLVTTALVMAAAVSLTGCAAGSAPGSPTTDSRTPASDTSLADVQKAGTLIVGTEGTYRPFSFHENGSGPITGFDVEIIEAVAGKLDVEVTFEETQWDGIFAGLEAGRFDVIANQVSINDERAAKYDFSTPYTYSTGVIVVPSDETSITSFDSLAGKTTAQSLTSNWYTLAEDSGATVQAVEGWAESVALVQQGRVDATVNDKLTFLDYTKESGNKGLKIAAETEEQSESAVALKKGSTSLKTAIDSALEELRADGTLADISEKYFGEDVTQ
ncbi:MAG: polar amino acid transporter substrate-binding protein [Cryobacterium sp.]|jgi:cystine transport system substrate-binding protein|nr:polar amino acid transporter substrate-binding protein [Cryobacterium sp.]